MNLENWRNAFKIICLQSRMIYSLQLLILQFSNYFLSMKFASEYCIISWQEVLELWSVLKNYLPFLIAQKGTSDSERVSWFLREHFIFETNFFLKYISCQFLFFQRLRRTYGIFRTGGNLRQTGFNEKNNRSLVIISTMLECN